MTTVIQVSGKRSQYKSSHHYPRHTANETINVYSHELLVGAKLIHHMVHHEKERGQLRKGKSELLCCRFVHWELLVFTGNIFY